MRSLLAVLALTVLPWAAAQSNKAQSNKYDGPRPPKPDTLYLMHADNLVPLETGVAKEESRKDATTYTVQGTISPARTPMPEPIFLLQSQKVQPDRLSMYKMNVKNGQREVVIPAAGKKSRDTKPVRLTVNRLGEGLYRIEASEILENGEYCLSPDGSNDVHCLQVY